MGPKHPKHGNKRSRPERRLRQHYYECEEVICILQGMGEIAIEDRKEAFAADCTLILPPRVVHQITNTGEENMRLVAWLSETPGRVFLPSGEQLALPWDGQDAR
jgi:mannose-6-phosphate isomerase-like protein (cupin superfamily)